MKRTFTAAEGYTIPSAGFIGATWDSACDKFVLDPRTAAVLALGEYLLAALKDPDRPSWGVDYYLKDCEGYESVLYAAKTADSDKRE